MNENTLTGRVVEVGDIECLQEPGCDAKAGLVVFTTMEQLQRCGRNLAFAEVEIRLKGADSGPVAGPITAAYERFKHLDRVFDMVCDADGTENSDPFHMAARDLWRAIKESLGKVTP